MRISDRIKTAWNRQLESWTSRIARAADNLEAKREGKEAPEPEKVAPVPVMPNRLLSISEQRELGFLSNRTSQYSASFDDRCEQADKLAEGAPPPIVMAGFVRGGPGYFEVDPRTNERLAERAVADATRKYGLKFGFSPPTPRL